MKDLDTIIEFICVSDNSNDVTISIRKSSDLLFIAFFFFFWEEYLYAV